MNVREWLITAVVRVIVSWDFFIAKRAYTRYKKELEAKSKSASHNNHYGKEVDQ